MTTTCADWDRSVDGVSARRVLPCLQPGWLWSYRPFSRTPAVRLSPPATTSLLSGSARKDIGNSGSCPTVRATATVVLREAPRMSAHTNTTAPEPNLHNGARRVFDTALSRAHVRVCGGRTASTRRSSALAAGQNERRLDDGRAVAQIRRRLENRQDLPAITSRQESEALWKGETWFRRTSLVHFGAVPEEADEVAARLGVGRPREHAGGDKGRRRLGLWLRRGGSRRRVSVTLDRRRRGCCLRGRRRRRRLPGSGSARDRGSVRPGRLRVHRTRGTVAGRRLCLRDRGQCFLRRLHGNLRGVVPATLADHHPGRAARKYESCPRAPPACPSASGSPGQGSWSSRLDSSSRRRLRGQVARIVVSGAM